MAHGVPEVVGMDCGGARWSLLLLAVRPSRCWFLLRGPWGALSDGNGLCRGRLIGFDWSIIVTVHFRLLLGASPSLVQSLFLFVFCCVHKLSARPHSQNLTHTMAKASKRKSYTPAKKELKVGLLVLPCLLRILLLTLHIAPHPSISWFRFQVKPSVGGEKTIQDMKNLQKSPKDFQIPLAPFYRAVKEITEVIAHENALDFDGFEVEHYKYSKEAITLLRGAAESFLTDLFGDSVLAQLHERARKTLMARDIQLVIKNTFGGKQQPLNM